MSKFQAEKIEIKKSGSAMTCAISQLVYMPNFRAIRQSVWEKNANRRTGAHQHTDTLDFIKIDIVINEVRLQLKNFIDILGFYKI